MSQTQNAPRDLRGVSFSEPFRFGYLGNGEAYQAGMTAPVYLSWMYFLTSGEW